MLGRLEMTVDEAIHAFLTLAEAVFKRDSYIPASVSLSLSFLTNNEKYSKHLEQIMKTLLRSRGVPEDEMCFSQQRCLT